jgi:hypothetical protein
MRVKSLMKNRQEEGVLPNLIIIGAMKCGTTTLHHHLNLHPQILMSREKELDFFVSKRKWERGIEWYKSHFVGEAKIYGESSPNYTNYPCWTGVPEKMYSIVPEAKLIYILRDPIERIISNYIHQYAARKESQPLNKALSDYDNNVYISRSKYYTQLEQYLQYFPETNILVITLEDLSSQPHKTMENVLDFLGLDKSLNFNPTPQKLHRSIFKRRKSQWGEVLSRSFMKKTIKKMPPEIRYNFEKIFYLPFSQKVEKPTLDEKLRERLIDYLLEDINRLRNYTGRDFKEWSV